MQVIDKIDLQASDSDAKLEVVEFVTSAAKTLLSSKPFVFLISSRLALEAKQNPDGCAILPARLWDPALGMFYARDSRIR